MGLTKRDYNWVAGVPAKVKELSLKADGDEELVDLIGYVRSAEIGLKSVRDGAAIELPANSKGKQWVMKQGRICTRSYNTSHLLLLFHNAMRSRGSLTRTLRTLLDLGVIKITWQYTKLMEVADQYNITLRVAKHEIQDGDPDADIGELWGRGYPSYEPIT